MSSHYFVFFQFADQGDGDRSSPAGEKLDLHEEREERLKTAEEPPAVICGVNQRWFILVQLESEGLPGQISNRTDSAGPGRKQMFPRSD